MAKKVDVSKKTKRVKYDWQKNLSGSYNEVLAKKKENTRENISDKRGRALEYIIVKEIMDNQPNDKIQVSEYTIQTQNRDKKKFDTLSQEIKDDYNKCKVIIYEWLCQKFIVNEKKIFLNRVTDEEAKKGNVTDIEIKIEKKKINLSIKHNHRALKHHRPSSTAQQCGHDKNSKQDLEFRNKYEEIKKHFFKKAQDLLPTARYYRELKEIQNDFIEKILYEPISNLVADSIIKFCRNEDNSQFLFNFIVGDRNYYKVIDYHDRIEIYKFSELLPATHVETTREKSNYITLTFSNEWKIKMRLHTAASEFQNLDLKWDAQPVNLEEIVPKEIIRKI